MSAPQTRRAPRVIFLLSLTAIWLSAALLPPASRADGEAPAAPPPGNPAPEAVAPEAAPEPRADLGPVNDLVRAGAYGEAEKSLALIQQEFPDDPRVLFMRGELLLALQRPDDALPLLQRCAELDPERERLSFQLGTALQASGDRAGAIEAFGREIEQNEDPRVRVMAHLNRALLFQREQEWDAAAGELEAVLELEPTRLEVHGDLVTLFLEAGRLDDAARTLEEGLAAGFRSAQHRYSLGARYLNEENYESAAGAFRASLEIDPNYADAARNLGVALDSLGQDAEAVELFRRYLELKPEAPDAEQITARIRESEGG